MQITKAECIWCHVSIILCSQIGWSIFEFVLVLCINNRSIWRFLSTFSEHFDDFIALLFRYHLAEKKIPSIHGHTMGLKLEQFIFDAFPYAPSTALFEVTIFRFSLI